MKTLLLVRHAKSSWNDAALTDFERPLNKRGLRDAPFMAELIRDKGMKPDLIISSPANRAFTTAKHFAEAANYPIADIRKELIIYEQGPKKITALLKELDDEVDTCYIFGHNPDFTFLATYFSGNYFQNVPTCGCVCLEFDIDSWSDIEEENARLVFYEYPKKYSDS
ncbi:MAG: SixA phosphatase family protein [Candidatus Kapaibacterium sp.]